MISMLRSFRLKLAEYPFMCHQLPERSFSYAGEQFPVCARCTGVMIGQAVGFVVYLFLEFSIPLYINIVFVLPSAIDWAIQALNIYESTNLRRLFTGVLLGFGYIGIIMISFSQIIYLFSVWWSK